MQLREKPNSDEQIALMMGAQKRVEARLRHWMFNDEVKAALYRYDEGHDLSRQPKRAAVD